MIKIQLFRVMYSYILKELEKLTLELSNRQQMKSGLFYYTRLNLRILIVYPDWYYSCTIK